MRCLALLLLLAAPLAAHVVSLSTGEVRVEGRLLHYEFRMPLYEISHVPGPDQLLLAQIRFHSDGEPGRLTESECRAFAEDVSYRCTATYEFTEPVEILDVECRYHDVTVPNHVHVLRAFAGDRSDQAVFDLSFPAATLRFRPPARFEIAVTGIGAGLRRALGGPAQLLFFFTLVLAARTRRELYALAATFIAGEITACLAGLWLGTLPPPFIQAAALLTIAYLAFEVLALPKAGHRSLIVGFLGLIHGLYFAYFLESSGHAPALFLAGIALADIAALALLAALFSRLNRALTRKRPATRWHVQTAAGLVLLISLSWFVVQLQR
ncbi:MAG: HupE/UreJ family protein [Bryobacteraceae bacterium]